MGGAGPLREAIRAATRRPEPECVPPLIEAARLDPAADFRIEVLARRLVEELRARGPDGGPQSLIHEYSLSSEEGVALMCLAEALLRIPDDGTRDALIRDKVARRNWRRHLGPERTLFVNAATWGLMVTGRLVGVASEEGLGGALDRLLARGGEPIIRAGVDAAMRLMGGQFVTGQTIEEALRNARPLERQGFRYSYDMLGEAATTAEDAERYFAAYRDAIGAIGAAAAGRGPYLGPGISVKLSALHPRYRRAQSGRVMDELLPRLKTLARLAKAQDIGFNIDAEESDRLDISLDLLEALCLDPELSGWNGLGFVVQAYGKRCYFVIDWLIALAHRSAHRLMVRLVKGAYWDAEIKQAQLDGLSDYPVFTRKLHTDVSYLACARKLLGARDAVFPQFATHNAQTLAAVYEMAGRDFSPISYEFQCLHGMGEPLYSLVVGPDKLDRPCRIYAPVGTHETLLAYLVRRLLENGANTSFVHRITDEAVTIPELTANPVERAAALVPPGLPHPRIALPRDIVAPRRNSAGLDLADERELGRLGAALRAEPRVAHRAVPLLADGPVAGAAEPVTNPADRADRVGEVESAGPELTDRAFAAATPGWAKVGERAARLRAAADLLQGRMDRFLALMMREAGKTAANGIAEVREAVDFLRYYADRAEEAGEAPPLGKVVCISPWNFPLSIFTGQIAAALAAGNAVIAKPAEETPLTAAAMVEVFYEAGVTPAALQVLPGAGETGAALVGHPETAGVVFTGSLEVARSIQRQLGGRLLPNGRPVPLIAETGGINAMIVDSSALAEQVVGDVLSSAFDSAGQRCSALRLLCLQEEVADRILGMLKGAMGELAVGNPDRLSTDLGPVITQEAAGRIEAHIDGMRRAGHRVFSLPLAAETRRGTFVPPTLIELDDPAQLDREVFGPVLHVVRYRREALDALIDAINAKGFGLTFGLHTRIDETVERVGARIRAGNIYVNRNMIGAVVGVQPFGGQGLSGTGPKAGGPLYVRRLSAAPPPLPERDVALSAEQQAFHDWLAASGKAEPAAAFLAHCRRSPAGWREVLSGPAGERNSFATLPRGEVLLLHDAEADVLAQLSAVFATGNRAVVGAGSAGAALARKLPSGVAARMRVSADWTAEHGIEVVLAADPGWAQRALETVAGFPGKIIAVESGPDYGLDLLVREVSTSINTAAAGGNASLIALGED
ncbi:MAG TPA: bifunctional proline dehydrogenase/L-glutamate gamma-semialdehyde dehydrogenase PutA [Devosiaceae bacterium]|nr:bifunctional proline dehydrogenase/L-glutamate gamma-semialdehyde dehydrogenase PutA [Devosiaceae bacterium]